MYRSLIDSIRYRIVWERWLGVNTGAYGGDVKRLSETDWLKHGLKTLAKTGFSGLKAEPMARSLGVSKGSFYWHFEDLAAFHQKLLDYWRSTTTDWVIRDIEQDNSEPGRLEALMWKAFRKSKHADLDQAIRHWAQHDKRVARRLQSVDQARIAYLCKLLRRTGDTEKDVLRGARFIYAASLGDRLIADNACPAFGRADISELAAASLQRRGRRSSAARVDAPPPKDAANARPD
ncbi:MAG: TetR/AcrR family transcriptional regulator [Pseudomonadota bacterium]